MLWYLYTWYTMIAGAYIRLVEVLYRRYINNTRPRETAAVYCFWRPPSTDSGGGGDVKANALQQSCTRDTPTMTACERKNDGRRILAVYNIIIIMFVREDLAQNNSNKTSWSFKSPRTVQSRVNWVSHCIVYGSLARARAGYNIVARYNI